MNTDYCPVTKFKRVTHVIFDLDGTILDTEQIYANTIMDIATEYGKVLTNEVYNEIAGCRLKEAATIAISLMDLPLTVDEFSKKFRELSSRKIPEATFLPGAEKMIRHLHSNRIPIAVATSSTQEDFEYKINFHKEVFNLFHHFVCGGTDPEVTRSKPFPDIFLVCASRFVEKPEPSACLVFEDAPNGVQAALAAGMQVVMFPNERVPHYKWKSATLRLDSFEYMVPEAFGLPPFPTEGDHNFFASRSTNMSVAEELNTAISPEIEPTGTINFSVIEMENNPLPVVVDIPPTGVVSNVPAELSDGFLTDVDSNAPTEDGSTS